MVKIYTEQKFESGIAMPCFHCGKDTTNRIPTDYDVGAELGEESWHLSAPICDKCIALTPNQ